MENTARIRLVDGKEGLVAFASVTVTGTMFLSNIVVRENQNGEAFLAFPNKLRVKNGTEVLDKDGKKVYDAVYGPATAETRTAVMEMIFTAVQDAIDGKTPQHEKGTPGAFVRLINEDGSAKDGIVAYASVIAEGTFFGNDIAVRENKEGEAYLTFPNKLRMKNGTEVLDKDGKKVYDAVYGPASAETRTLIQDTVFAAVQEEMDKEA